MTKKHKKPDPTTLPVFSRDEQIKSKVERMEIDLAARREVEGRAWRSAEFAALAMSLGDSLKTERAECRFLVHNMIGARHNVSISGNNGVGKTTLGINLIRSLVDHKPFLDAETNLPSGGRVEWWNGEMDADDFNDYARPISIRKARSVSVKHLRDFPVPLLNDAVVEDIAKHFRQNDIKVWCVDSWARLCAWSGLSENKNEDIAQLTSRIDQIKREAGVHAFVVLAHTGRVRAEEGEEHARGATTFDDWADARWTYLKPDPRPSAPRFLSTLKVRGVHDRDKLWSREVCLADDNTISLGDAVRSDDIDREFMEKVVAVVAEQPGLNGTQVASALGLSKTARGNKTGNHLRQAVVEGAVHSERKGNANLWFPGPPDTTKIKLGSAKS